MDRRNRAARKSYADANAIGRSDGGTDGNSNCNRYSDTDADADSDGNAASAGRTARWADVTGRNADGRRHGDAASAGSIDRRALHPNATDDEVAGQEKFGARAVCGACTYADAEWRSVRKTACIGTSIGCSLRIAGSVAKRFA